MMALWWNERDHLDLTMLREREALELVHVFFRRNEFKTPGNQPTAALLGWILGQEKFVRESVLKYPAEKYWRLMGLVLDQFDGFCQVGSAWLLIRQHFYDLNIDIAIPPLILFPSPQ